MIFINIATLEELDSDDNVDVCITPGWVRREDFMRNAVWAELALEIELKRQHGLETWAKRAEKLLAEHNATT